LKEYFIAGAFSIHSEDKFIRTITHAIQNVKNKLEIQSDNNIWYRCSIK